MMSRCSSFAPACSTRRISSRSSAKSQANSDGATSGAAACKSARIRELDIQKAPKCLLGIELVAVGPNEPLRKPRQTSGRPFLSMYKHLLYQQIGRFVCACLAARRNCLCGKRLSAGRG